MPTCVPDFKRAILGSPVAVWGPTPWTECGPVHCFDRRRTRSATGDPNAALDQPMSTR
jgi:hypothetical protein